MGLGSFFTKAVHKTVHGIEVAANHTIVPAFNLVSGNKWLNERKIERHPAAYCGAVLGGIALGTAGFVVAAPAGLAVGIAVAAEGLFLPAQITAAYTLGEDDVKKDEAEKKGPHPGQ